MLWHIPNGITFAIGLPSMMFASGPAAFIVRFAGSTTSELGATPKLHCIIAPMQTCIPIVNLPRAWF
jgi:hypothetical protein